MLHIVLVEPEIPQNCGNIARTCAATGSQLHLIRPLGFDISEKAVRRAGLDYWNLVEVFDYENLEDFFRRRPEAERDLWLTTTKAPRSYQEARFTADSWLFFGKETAGLPLALRERYRDRCVRLPMVSEARSLCPDATLMEHTLLLTSSTLSQMTTRVPAWLEEIGANREEQDKPDAPDATSLKMNITVGDRTLTATMEDNAAGRDFLSRLPLEITLNDYNGTTEKIFYPDPALTTEGVTRGCAPTPGDITIYAPWGNVAIFCKNWSHSSDLIKIGRIDGDGIDALSIGGDIRVKIERQ